MCTEGLLQCLEIRAVGVHRFKLDDIDPGQCLPNGADQDVDDVVARRLVGTQRRPADHRVEIDEQIEDARP